MININIPLDPSEADIGPSLLAYAASVVAALSPEARNVMDVLARVEAADTAKGVHNMAFDNISLMLGTGIREFFDASTLAEEAAVIVSATLEAGYQAGIEQLLWELPVSSDDN